MTTPKAEPPVQSAVPVVRAGSPPSAGSENAMLLGSEFERQKWLNLLLLIVTSLALLVILTVAIRLSMLISHTLLLFALGGLMGYALAPLVSKVQQRPKGKPRPRWVGVSVVFAGLFLVTAIAGALLGNTLVHQVRYVATDHAHMQATGRTFLSNSDQWLAAHDMPLNLEQYVDNPPPTLKTWGQDIGKAALRFLAHLSTAAVESAIVLLIALYFLIYGSEMREKTNSWLPDHLLPYAEQWESDVNRVLGGFVRGQLVLALITGVAAAIICAVLGISVWLLIGVLVVFASLVPVFGPYVGAVPAILAAAMTPEGGMSTATRVILVVVLFGLMNEIGSKVLYPRLVGAALGLHEVVVLFVLFAGLEVGGIWGVLFAAPLTALALATAVQLYRLWKAEPPISLAELSRLKRKEVQAPDTSLNGT